MISDTEGNKGIYCITECRYGDKLRDCRENECGNYTMEGRELCCLTCADDNDSPDSVETSTRVILSSTTTLPTNNANLLSSNPSDGNGSMHLCIVLKEHFIFAFFVFWKFCHLHVIIRVPCFLHKTYAKFTQNLNVRAYFRLKYNLNFFVNCTYKILRFHCLELFIHLFTWSVVS